MTVSMDRQQDRSYMKRMGFIYLFILLNSYDHGEEKFYAFYYLLIIHFNLIPAVLNPEMASRS